MLLSRIKSAIRNPLVSISIFVAIFIVGFYVISEKTTIDALPDLSENQVIVMTMRPGQSPEIIESQVTYPLTVNMQGLAGVSTVRAMSQIGISMITVVFEDDVDIYFARDRVLERLSIIKDQLPNGVSPSIGPDATGLGRVYQYYLDAPDTYNLQDLRALQDFVIKYELQGVEGVAEIASLGGYKKTFQIIVDPAKLGTLGIGLNTVMMSLQGSNNTVSAKTLTTADNEIVVQGLGYLDNIDEIKNTIVGKTPNGTSITIADIGYVREGGAYRRSVYANGEKEVVGGIVVMRYGKNPVDVIDAIKEKISHIETILPQGVTIKTAYDRTTLIQAAVQTLQNILRQELLITAIILAVFLYHFGATITTILSLIFGVVVTFILMYLFGISSNIMSLGGIAIALGTMVDAIIVIGENIYIKLTEKIELTPKERITIIMDATSQVAMPVVFAVSIIILSFVPIFALQGMEGKLFRPLAYTNVFAMVGALIAALFIVPVCAIYFFRGRFRTDKEIWIVKKLQGIYERILLTCLSRRKTTLAIMLALFAGGVAIYTQIGSEFMPPLDEGVIMYMPMTIPDVSSEKAAELLLETNKILAGFPEVQEVVGKAGRAETATDPAPLAMFETIITLKPRSQWRKDMTIEKLTRAMNRAIRIDNVRNGFTQPIIGRIDMLASGIRAQVGIKVFGDDPMVLEQIAIDIEKMLGHVPGAAGAAAIRTAGLTYINIDLNDQKLSHYGISKQMVLDMIASGIGGMQVSTMYDGRERYGIEIRLQSNYRNNIEAIKSIPLRGSNGQQIIMDTIADISLIEGPATIKSEDGVMMSAVQTNVQGIDLGTFVTNAQQYLTDNLELPEGYYIERAGQYENQLRANRILAIVVPVVLLLILFILYIAYRDGRLVGIITVSIPLSLVGGVIALYIYGFNFSVAVWIGMIALFGNAIETGVVIMVYLENSFRNAVGIQSLDEPNDETGINVHNIVVTKKLLRGSILDGAIRRLRPIMMTALTSIIGLLPMLYTTDVGSEIQKPLAVVVVFGLITSIFLTLIVIPLLFSYVKEYQYNITQ